MQGSTCSGRVPGAVYVAAVAAVCIASSPFKSPRNSSASSPHRPAPADGQFGSSWPYSFRFLSFRRLARDSVCGSLHRAIAELGFSKIALAAPLDMTERMAGLSVFPLNIRFGVCDCSLCMGSVCGFSRGILEKGFGALWLSLSTAFLGEVKENGFGSVGSVYSLFVLFRD